MEVRNWIIPLPIPDDVLLDVVVLIVVTVKPIPKMTLITIQPCLDRRKKIVIKVVTEVSQLNDRVNFTLTCSTVQVADELCISVGISHKHYFGHFSPSSS